MKNKLFISLLSIACFFSSCKNEPEVVILSTKTNVLNISPINGNESLSISSTSTWSAKSSDSWCLLSDLTGTGNKEIVVLCYDNLSGQEREAKITINSGDQSKSVVVKQTGGNIIFKEYFDDNSKNWPIRNDSLAENILNGFYNVKNTSTSSSFFVGTKSIISNYNGNYLITMLYKQASGTNPFGLTFANRNSENFYRILVSPNGYYNVTQRLENVNTTIVNAFSELISDENTISLLKNGNNCDIYINDSKVNRFDLPTAFGSYVGFYSCPQTEIHIYEIMVVQF